MINYEYMWTIFKPGNLLYFLELEQPRAFQLRSYCYRYKTTGEDDGLDLQMEYVDFDGERMGNRDAATTLDAFVGTMKVLDLNAYPIEFHKEQDKIKRELIERGRKWEELAGMQFRNYNGVALAGDGKRFSVSGRVVIDAKTYHRMNPDHTFRVHDFRTPGENSPKRLLASTLPPPPGIYDDFRLTNGVRSIRKMSETLDLGNKDKPDIPPLTEEQCMITTSLARGFSFSEKEFFDFFIDKLQPVDWNPNCFDELVLPKTQKELVKALVATHVQDSFKFDDIVKGKGKGLILVLHGPPGVGKTLTAETVAEYCKRPLYAVSSGDLGTYSSALDKSLGRITDLASTFKAVLLIDEADVFLERRSLHDLSRNSLVSIFLRELEHYEGILFLTTNRVETFDEAFKSRIHVPLKYEDLTSDSRKKIWRNFLTRFTKDELDLDEKGYESLAEAKINGRQIKNVVRTAKSLAQFNEEKLDLKKLKQAIQIQKEFEDKMDLHAQGIM